MMKKLLLIVASSSLLVGCASNWNFAGLSFFNTNSQISNEIEVDQEALHLEGNRPFTKEEKKVFKNAFDRGMEFAKEKLENQTSFIGPRDFINLQYVSANPELDIIEKFLEKNPKAKGVHKDIILMAAMAYDILPEFLVFEGLRTLERQKKLKARGVSWTLKSDHLTGGAIDIIGKNKKGKFSFKAIDDLGMARGVMYAVYTVLKAKGKICLVWDRVLRWKKIRDAYHIALKDGPETESCERLQLLT